MVKALPIYTPVLLFTFDSMNFPGEPRLVLIELHPSAEVDVATILLIIFDEKAVAPNPTVEVAVPLPKERPLKQSPVPSPAQSDVTRRVLVVPLIVLAGIVTDCIVVVEV